jgi:RimJ/RimL family protein N-acetyltransferase
MVDPTPLIRPARVSDAEDFAAYVALQVAQSGQNGMPIYALSRSAVRDEMRARATDRWSKSLTEPLWGRAWLLYTESPWRVVGHVELVGGRVPVELHRAVLAMGMFREFTAQGHGRRLIDTAVRFARDEAKLGWLDLGVFANNEPARKLYTRMGFEPTGMRRDAFRIDGVSIDDIQMTLAL